jgi:hypothetical protein
MRGLSGPPARVLDLDRNSIDPPEPGRPRRRSDVGNRNSEAAVLNSLGEAALDAGRPGEARGHLEAALALAVELGIPEQQARARAGLEKVVVEHAAAAPDREQLEPGEQ